MRRGLVTHSGEKATRKEETRTAQEQLEAVHAAGVGYTWERANTVAKNRVYWMILVEALRPRGSKGIMFTD